MAMSPTARSTPRLVVPGMPTRPGHRAVRSRCLTPQLPSTSGGEPIDLRYLHKILWISRGCGGDFRWQ